MVKSWIVKNTALWMIFEAQTEQKKYLADEAARRGLDFETYTMNYFETVDGRLFYKDTEITELPQTVLMRSNLRNKYNIHQFLETNGIKQPKFSGFDNETTYESLAAAFGVPFVAKDRFGSEGKGVFLIHNKNEYASMLARVGKQNVMFQKFVENSFGKDLRAYVVGGRVFGIMRQNKENFRSNTSLGGHETPYEFTKEQKQTAVKIADILSGGKPRIMSVDFLVAGNNELEFCEANTNPPCPVFKKDLENITYPICKEIINYTESLLEKVAKKTNCVLGGVHEKEETKS